MRATFELMSLECITSKSPLDAVKLYMAVAADNGQGDKLESASEEAVYATLDRTAYELRNGDDLDLGSLPPRSRQNWRTSEVSFSDGSHIQWTLAGIGLGKPELGGGGGGDGPFASFMETLREGFINLTVPGGGFAIEALLDFAEDVAAKADQQNCLGPLFSFSGGFSLYAARGGARSVTDLDISSHALDSAGRNFQLNQHMMEIANCPHERIQADVFQWLRQSPDRQFDLIVLDPPSLA
ncbi:MAG: hypothetical protein EOO77_08080, partial [Oxalobacteraceae bacterium]